MTNIMTNIIGENDFVLENLERLAGEQAASESAAILVMSDETAGCFMPIIDLISSMLENGYVVKGRDGKGFLMGYEDSPLTRVRIFIGSNGGNRLKFRYPVIIKVAEDESGTVTATVVKNRFETPEKSQVISVRD